MAWKPLCTFTIFIASTLPAYADDLCVDRPGLATPPCTLTAGEVVAEFGLAAWEHDRDSNGVSNTAMLGDLTLRLGLGDQTEVQLSLPAHTTIRQRGASLLPARTAGWGDTTIALRHGLDGAAAHVALMGFLTLPTGSAGIGAGDWGAGALLPVELDLPGAFTLGLTPHAEAAVNQSGHGRHFSWGGIAGLSHAVTSNLSVTGEIAMTRDNDPAGRSTQTISALSLAWQPRDGFQIDIELDLALNAAAPRRAVMFGLARRF